MGVRDGPESAFINETSSSVTAYTWELLPDLLSSLYYEKAGHLYFANNIINGADLNTFMVALPQHSSSLYDHSYARDKNHIYWSGQIIDVLDPSSFSIISFGSNGCDLFLYDRFHVYHGHGETHRLV
jgi:hypothetical protein